MHEASRRWFYNVAFQNRLIDKSCNDRAKHRREPEKP
jgi:hypothetical protein